MHDDDTHDLRVSARTAHLTASTDDDGGPPYTFSGISVAAGDILHMDDGTRVLFTAEELKQAAETQAGEPLSVDHPTDDEGRPIYPPPTDESPGTVPKAGWLEDQQAVGYEATTHDQNIAVGVQAGSYDVSVHPRFELGEFVDDRDAYKATNIRFQDLSVVSKGDSPSNTAEWGPNQALASYTLTADIGAELDAGASASAGGGGDTPQQSLVSSVVNGTLRALGVDTDAVDADTLRAQTSDEAAESATDTGSSSSSDTTMDRDSTIDTLADEHGLSRDALTDMDDADLETLTTKFGDAGSTDTPDDPSGGTDDTGGTTVEVDIGNHESFDDYLNDRVSEAVASAQSQTDKAEKVDELIAKSDDHDDEDREALMASAESLIDSQLKQLRGQTAASIPGVAGVATSLTADAGSGGDDDLDEYGTGMQED